MSFCQCVVYINMSKILMAKEASIQKYQKTTDIFLPCILKKSDYLLEQIYQNSFSAKTSYISLSSITLDTVSPEL